MATLPPFVLLRSQYPSVAAMTMLGASRAAYLLRGRRKWIAGATVSGGILLVALNHLGDPEEERHHRITMRTSTRPSSNTTATRLVNVSSLCWVNFAQTVQCEQDKQEEEEKDDDDDDDEQALMPFVENGDDSSDLDTGYTEAERFYQCLDYHRSLLFDYYRRWGPVGETAAADDQENNPATTPKKKTTWPRRVPTADEINALETDLKFCQRAAQKDPSSCHALQFRIASFYVAQDDDPVHQRKGFKQIKELAEQGNPDGMCYYGEYRIQF